jgi:genome maintenance exonuclease 1
MFTHVKMEFPKLKRETIDGVRYYTVNGKPMVSITSVTSHFNKEIFSKWRKRVGEEEANRISKRSTDRGTKVHTCIENFLYNKEIPSTDPLPKQLFLQAKNALSNINNIYALEESLYSEFLGVAGTVDCIAEYTGENGIPELAIIDFKTAEKPKPVNWIENYFVQATAYGVMFHEMMSIDVKKLVILMTCENGEVAVYEEYDIEKYYKLLEDYINKFIEDKMNGNKI